MKRWIWIIIAVAVIAVVLVGVRLNAARRAAQALEDMETVVAEQGSLTALVGATGTVRANQSAMLTYTASGKVGEILVDVGEVVDADEVLATLDRSSLSTQLILAETDLLSAQRALDELHLSESQQAQARLALIQAQDALNTAVYNWRYFRLSDPSPTWYEQESVDRQLNLAEQRLEQSQEDYEALGDDDPGKAAALQAVNDSRAALDLANWLVAWYEGEEPGEIDHALLDANVAIAQANLEDAQRAWERVAEGPHPDDIAAAEARVAAAEATLAMARVSAPFTGTITSTETSEGDLVNPGSLAFTLTDFSHLYVDVSISEIDINRVQEGQEVTLSFDAIPNQTYGGSISAVGLVGTVTQGVVNFKVTIELVDADEAVKPGMTAAVSIVVQRVDDALLVPNRAVRVVDGQRVVYILVDGEPEIATIELGASSDMYSEVIGGDLRVGDVIILSVINDFSNFGGHPPGMMFGGRP
jgi:HlyD family secretion protein